MIASGLTLKYILKRHDLSVKFEKITAIFIIFVYFITMLNNLIQNLYFFVDSPHSFLKSCPGSTYEGNLSRTVK